MSLVPDPTIPQDSPDSEGLLFAQAQVVDAFRRKEVGDVVRRLEELLGPHDQAAAEDPDKPGQIRGGPYPAGDYHRRVWRLDWDRLQAKVELDVEAKEDLPASADVILQWMDHVPFAMLVVRGLPPRRGDAGWLQHHAERLLERLPHRLGPNNVQPRSKVHWLLCAKASAQALADLNESLRSGRSGEDAFRAGLGSLVPGFGVVEGTLRVKATGYSLLIEGNGWGFADDPVGPFRMFVFAHGNLGPHKGWEWLVPMWSSANLQASFWPDFNTLPFFECAERQAREVYADCSAVDLRLAALAERIHEASAQDEDVRHSQWVALHRELVVVQADIERLRTRLHLSATRSAVPLPLAPDGPGVEHVLEDQGIWGFLRGSERLGVLGVVEEKQRVEQSAFAVLDGLAKRADAAASLVSSDRSHLDAVAAQRMARQGQRLATANAWLAGAAVVLAAATVWLAR